MILNQYIQLIIEMRRNFGFDREVTLEYIRRTFPKDLIEKMMISGAMPNRLAQEYPLYSVQQISRSIKYLEKIGMVKEPESTDTISPVKLSVFSSPPRKKKNIPENFPIHLLGMVPDFVLAKKYGISVNNVEKLRDNYNIKKFEMPEHLKDILRIMSRKGVKDLLGKIPNERMLAHLPGGVTDSDLEQIMKFLLISGNEPLQKKIPKSGNLLYKTQIKNMLVGMPSNLRRSYREIERLSPNPQNAITVLQKFSAFIISDKMKIPVQDVLAIKKYLGIVDISIL